MREPRPTKNSWNIQTMKEMLRFLPGMRLQLLGCLENSDQVTCVLWFLCKYMNGIIFDDKAIDGESIWQIAYLLDESYKAACRKPSISALQSRGGESDSWKKPNQGFLKMNTDASWLRSTRRGAAGQASTF
ncbi:hypothetical protein LIER_37551 [Lithospermum erythrorhizon]|uniref:Uncharacterized protein n=1 Tax=Lithospermum erythrorhizon TaxID=34254 RepID=A0AAV3PM00_LITER